MKAMQFFFIPAALLVAAGAVMPAVAGPGQAPAGQPVAMIFDEAISTNDPEMVQSIILSRVFDRYANEQRIEVSEAEIDAFVNHIEQARRTDREQRQQRLAELEQLLQANGPELANRDELERERSMLAELLAGPLAEDDLTPEEEVQVVEMRRAMGQAFIRQWKINRALYQEYGGRVIFQQGGPEPLDAYRRHLEKLRDNGVLVIRDPEVEAHFWRYFTTDSMHSFMSEAQAAEAFRKLPWE